MSPGMRTLKIFYNAVNPDDKCIRSFPDPLSFSMLVLVGPLFVFFAWSVYTLSILPLGLDLQLGVLSPIYRSHHLLLRTNISKGFASK